MKAVIQRVQQAEVKVDGNVTGSINKGLLVFLGIGKEDNEDRLNFLVNKIINLRVFEDESGKMNLSVKDTNGEILVVSQFTLYGDVKKGYRPNFMNAAPPEVAEQYYELFIKKLKENGIKTETGKFGAMMQVHLINDGPVTIIIEK